MSGDYKNLPTMRQDRPLDAFLPELQEPQVPNELVLAQDALEASESPLVQAPLLHPSVLEVEVEGGWAWAMALWRAPKGQEDLDNVMQRAIERTLLQEMSRPPGYGGAEQRTFLGIHLFVFAPIHDVDRDVLARYGFFATEYVADQYAARLLSFKNEAKLGGWSCQDTPSAIFWSPMQHPDPDLAQTFLSVHEEIVRVLARQVWGMSPGMPSKAMAQALSKHISVSITPTLDGLHELDMILVERKTRTLRWLSPMMFQGLADFLGIIWIAEAKKQVQWALCEVDSDGLFLPPMHRIATQKGPVDVSIGEELVRLAMMPVEDLEQIPLMRDWQDGLLP